MQRAVDDAGKEILRLSRTKRDAEARLAEAMKALADTRSLVCEAAMTGFNCHDGDWADRLYRNNGTISSVLCARRVREGGKVDG